MGRLARRQAGGPAFLHLAGGFFWQMVNYTPLEDHYGGWEMM